MPRNELSDDCPGCRPVLAKFDPETGAVTGLLPADSPSMQAVDKVWAETTLEERQAWHAVTCQNSEVPWHRQGAEHIAKRIQEALAKLEPPAQA